MPGYDYSQPGAYFITICARDRLPLFADSAIANAAWDYVRPKFVVNGGIIVGVVLLHDHFHIIVEFNDKLEFTLGEFVMELKLGLWRTMRKAGCTDKKIWQKNYYEHVIRNNDDLIEKLKYMRENPLKAGLVERIEDWPFYWDRYLQD